MNILAPMIVKGAPINWRELSKVDPSCLNTQVVPRKHRSFFSHSNRVSNRVATSAESHDGMDNHTSIEELRSPEVTIPLASQGQHRYDLRSLQNNELTVPPDLLET